MRTYSIISSGAIIKRDDQTFIPFCAENVDYQQFVNDWENGATVLNVSGVAITYSASGLAALLVPMQTPL